MGLGWEGPQSSSRSSSPAGMLASGWIPKAKADVADLYATVTPGVEGSFRACKQLKAAL